jgi:CDP-paratose synthetase
MSKCLFLGGSSYVGLKLIKRLSSQGHEISCIIRSDDSLKKIQKQISGISFFTTNEASIPGQDFVFNLVCDYGLKNKDIDFLLESNVNYTLQQISKLKFGKIFNFSTALNKNLSYYAESKVALEDELTKRLSNVCNLKIQALYGPHSPDHYFINFLMKSLSSHQPELNLTGCTQKRDFVHVDDLVSAVCILMNHETLPQTIEIGSGTSYKLKSIAEFIQEITLSKTQINFGRLPMRLNEPMELKADTRYLENLGLSQFDFI